MRRILHLGLASAVIMVLALIGSPQGANGAVSDEVAVICDDGPCDTWDPDVTCTDYRATFAEACVSGHMFCDGEKTGPN